MDALEREFTHMFGGCTTVRGLEGYYLSRLGEIIRDRVNLVYVDAPLALPEHASALSRYTDRIRTAAFEALNEEAILVAVLSVRHSV